MRVCVCETAVYEIGSRHGIVRHQLLIEGEPDAPAIGSRGHRIQREPPALGARFERHGIAICRTEVLNRRPNVVLAGQLAPGVAVEVVQHRSAPVPFLRWRSVPFEVNAKRRVTRFAQRRDAPGTH